MEKEKYGINLQTFRVNKQIYHTVTIVTTV